MAFSVALNISLSGWSTPIQFNDVIVNELSAYDVTRASFIAPSSGLYWFHISVGTVPFTDCDVRLAGGYQMPNVLRTSNEQTQLDTTSRDDLQWLDEQEKRYVVSDFSLYSDSMYQTSWSSFSLQAASDPVVAFSVGLTSTFFTTGGDKVILFDIVLTDTFKRWNIQSGEYVTPLTGVYFIAITTGAVKGTGHQVLLRVGGLNQFGLSLTSSSHNGTDLLSRSGLIQVNNENSPLSLVLLSSTSSAAVMGDARYQTSLMGFRYEPTEDRTAAWSVYRSASITGPIDRLPFDTVLINIDGVWNSQYHYGVITMPGVYYLTISACMAAYTQLDMRLALNSTSYPARLFRNATQHNGLDTRSRAMLLRLVVGDIIYVELVSSGQVYSDSRIRQTSFSGFRIYA